MVPAIHAMLNTSNSSACDSASRGSHRFRSAFRNSQPTNGRNDAIENCSFTSDPDPCSTPM